MKPESAGDESSNPLSSERDYVDPFFEWRDLVKELKVEWKSLWLTRFDDKVRAEGIASKDFIRLFVDRGTVILATKDCKPPSFHEILKRYMPEVAAERFNVNPHTGGWRKFIREVVKGQAKEKRMRELPIKPNKNKAVNLQRKKGGRGWLHYSLE
ncbi:MAG: hypothetical protein QXK89_07915 [Candidatus Bathyarchaeia archaeon]